MILGHNFMTSPLSVSATKGANISSIKEIYVIEPNMWPELLEYMPHLRMVVFKIRTGGPDPELCVAYSRGMECRQEPDYYFEDTWSR